MKTKTLHRALAAAATVLALAAGPVTLAGPALAADAATSTAQRTGTEKVWPALPDHPALVAYATNGAGLDSWEDEEKLNDLTYRLMHDHKLAPSFAYSCEGYGTFAECMENADNLPYDKDSATDLAREAARVTHMHRSTSADGETVKIESFRVPTVNEDLNHKPMPDGSVNSFDLDYGDGAWTIAVMRWTAGTKVTYQWFLDGKAIPGAAGKVYHPRASDAGHLLGATATGYKDGWAPYTHTFEGYDVNTLDHVEGGENAAATGSTKIGATLTAKPGSWPAGTTLAYQWYRGSAKITGATKAAYSTTGADAGKALQARITASKPGYLNALVQTNTIQVNKPDLAIGAPSVSGTAKVGVKLTAKTGSWTTGTTLRYQWYANGAGIYRANASTFTPTAGQRGKSITVKVIGSKPGFNTASSTSKATARVAYGTLAAKTPAVTGTVKVGFRLTARAGAWTSGTKLSYQWFANGKTIGGAKSSTFTPGPAQRGSAVSVKVTGTKSGYTSAARTSKATKRTAYGTLTAKTPSISGTVQVGKTLTARPGSWTSGTKLSYRWYANGKPISKATKSTVKLANAQRGKKITVKVTGKRSGYTTVSKASKATGPAKAAAKKPTSPTPPTIKFKFTFGI